MNACIRLAILLNLAAPVAAQTDLVVKGEPKGTTLVISDKGRAATAIEVERLLDAGQRAIPAGFWTKCAAMPGHYAAVPRRPGSRRMLRRKGITSRG